MLEIEDYNKGFQLGYFEGHQRLTILRPVTRYKEIFTSIDMMLKSAETLPTT